MQISQDVIQTGIKQENRRAFLTLLRLKMMFRYGWVKEDINTIADTLSISHSTLRRRIKKLRDLGFVDVTHTGKYFLKNLDRKKKPLENYQRRLKKKKLYQPTLRTVRITMEMCDKEILAHLTAKSAAQYFRQCEYLRTLKEDREIMRNGGRTKSHHPKKVERFFRDNPKKISPENKKMVISDRKMADWLGITVKDFRRNVKLIWLNTGLVPWTSSLVNLEIPKFKFGEVPKGVFFHKGAAYTHTTQYHRFPLP